MAKNTAVDAQATGVQGRNTANCSAGAPIDDRVRRSKEIVLGTTLDLLTEGGIGGVSVDEVSRRSGVAKTTIYRHWPTRSGLVMEACTRMIAEQAVPDTGTLEGDVTAVLTDIADLLQTARWSSVVPSIIDAAERDADLAEIHGRIQLGHAAPLRAVIERAARKGEISAGTDPSATIAALLGPLFYRRWFSREPLDAKFVKAVIGNAIRGSEH